MKRKKVFGMSTLDKLLEKVIEAMPAYYREKFKTLVPKENGRLSPHWEQIDELRRGRDGSFNEGLYNATVGALVDLDILSCANDKGTYGLLADGVRAGPRLAGVLMCNFMEKEEVERYKQAMFPNAHYDVKIFRVESN